MSLWSDFLSHQGRPALKWKHYFPIYERHFARYVNRPVTMIEIGCGEGGSLQLWKKYFGPNARIIGILTHPLIPRARGICQTARCRPAFRRTAASAAAVSMSTVFDVETWKIEHGI